MKTIYNAGYTVLSDKDESVRIELSKVSDDLFDRVLEHKEREPDLFIENNIKGLPFDVLAVSFVDTNNTTYGLPLFLNDVKYVINIFFECDNDKKATQFANLYIDKFKINELISNYTDYVN